MSRVPWYLPFSILLAAPAAAQQEDASRPAAWEVSVVTRTGVTYSGVVLASAELDAAFGDERRPDPAALDPRLGLAIRWFNGLNGAVSFRCAELARIEILARYTAEDLESRRAEQAAARTARLQKEALRLAVVHEERAARLAAAEQARTAAAEAAAGERRLPPELQAWIDRFPPDQGWIPAKKAALYYQTVVLDNRAPSDAERAWLDSYDEWKQAYDAWLVLEKERLAEEARQRAAEGGDAAPAGADPAGAEGASVDPDQPTAAELARLPPPIDKAIPPPDKIKKETPKPVALDPAAPAPAKMKDGSRP